MGKAINWPEQFYDEVISENSDDVRIALRLGSLYYNNNYYEPNEVVDIRVNHKIVRRGVIVDNMKLMPIRDLDEDLLKKYKKELNDKQK